MNKVFPCKWVKQIDRSHWGRGPWDAEDVDREQWADPLTGYPCLAIRSDLGCWAGYVGVYPDHPAFGRELDCLPGHRGVNFTGYNDDIHFVAPPPDNPDVCVDETDPKSILDVIRMPDHLWFFGFDTAHAGDAIPSVEAALVHFKTSGTKFGTYRDIQFVKQCCANIAKALSLAERLGSVESLETLIGAD
jgi:hypothetical protein